MGNRLSKIATRTGDKGTTGLGDGTRVDKDSARVASLGDVDELNSFVGLLLCEEMPAALREELVSIQHDLFDLGGELCIPGYQMITDEHVGRLDDLLAKYNAVGLDVRALARAEPVCRWQRRAVAAWARAGVDLLP
jgi:cob(I)alamin adenosyltransferase